MNKGKILTKIIAGIALAIMILAPIGTVAYYIVATK